MHDDARTDVLDPPLELLGGAMRARPTLAWVDPQGGHEVLVDRRMVLGSAPSADVIVGAPNVSRLHCELVPRDDEVWVHDLGSRNGTFVDAVLVERARLGQGAVLRVGTIDVRVRYASTASAIELWPLDRFGPLLGRSVVMRELFARLERVAASDATVLLHGETGTGKDLAARAVHEASRRHAKPFVVFDCGAVPESLIESELFGHARGAFTGASEARIGSIEAANGGTLFLDEVGELSLGLQPKLLRFLESRTIRRVGETTDRPVDVRVVSATHRDLRQMVNRGAFREDLYFRLAVVPCTLPPLRERTDDLPLLVRRFLPEGATVHVGPELLADLSSRAWEGNVRELRNFVERALALGPEEALALLGADAGGAVQTSLPAPQLDVPFKDLREAWLAHLEREYVKGLLARHRGNVTAVASAAGLARTYVHRLMAKHGL